MLNQVILVGRIKEIGGDYISIAPEENNEIVVYCGENLYKQVNEYCKLNDMVGVKGKLIGDYVQAEKITFLTSRKVDSKEDNEEV